MKNKNSFELAVFVVLFLSLFLTLSITANNVLFAQTSTPPIATKTLIKDKGKKYYHNRQQQVLIKHN